MSERPSDLQYDTRRLAENLSRVWEDSQRFWMQTMQGFAQPPAQMHAGMGDPLNISAAFAELWARMLSDPQ